MRWSRAAPALVTAAALLALPGATGEAKVPVQGARPVSRTALNPTTVRFVRKVIVAKLPPPSHAKPIAEPEETEPVSGPPRTTGLVTLAPPAGPAPEAREATVTQVKAPGLTSNGLSPPDTQVAASSKFVVEMTNVSGAVFNHSGHLLKSFDLGSLFSGKPGTGSDPKVVFDGSSNRFYASYIASFTRGGGPSKIDLAVSKNPMGVWKVYRAISAASLMDQPKLGINVNKIVLGWNDIDSTAPPELEVIQKAGIAAFHNTVPAGTLPRDDSRLGISPAITISGGKAALAAAHDLGTGDAVVLAVVGVPGVTATTVVEQFDVDIADDSAPPAAAQPPVGGHGSPGLDTGDDRLESTVQFGEDLWTTGNDICQGAGDSQARSCLRLIDIGLAPLTVKTDADITRIGAFLMYPAVLIDGGGNLWLAFSSVSSSQFASSEVIEVPNAAIGSTVTGSTYRVGSSALSCIDSEGRNRFGDYTGIALDPARKNRGIWAATEFGDSGCNWKTELGNFTP